MIPDLSHAAIFALSALSIAGVIVRPFGWPEWVFVVAGSAILTVTGLVPWSEAVAGLLAGTDVYLFLLGMMLLAEVARRHGLFDYLAVFAARSARGSPVRLFVLIYGIGTLVTIFLSNDATAVVLTPAVIAVTRAVQARNPVPYLLICALVANAASFVLPISNPANIVVFGDSMPPLLEWLRRFAAPSAVAILVTGVLLFLACRKDLADPVRSEIGKPLLSNGGKIAAVGLVAAVAVLLGTSWFGLHLGVPTLIAGTATLAIASAGSRTSPVPVLSGISWMALLLVAGLFIIVRAIALTGLDGTVARLLQDLGARAGHWSPLIAGTIFGIATNITNNLPLGLFAGDVVGHAVLPEATISAILVGIDLGPNLSATGSLATILWLIALRRENIAFGALDFLKIGALVAVPTLFLTLLLV